MFDFSAYIVMQQCKYVQTKLLIVVNEISADKYLPQFYVIFTLFLDIWSETNLSGGHDST